MVFMVAFKKAICVYVSPQAGETFLNLPSSNVFNHFLLNFYGGSKCVTKWQFLLIF